MENLIGENMDENDDIFNMMDHFYQVPNISCGNNLFNNSKINKNSRKSLKNTILEWAKDKDRIFTVIHYKNTETTFLNGLTYSEATETMKNINKTENERAEVVICIDF